MANLLSEEDFGLKIYNRFPPKYREDDLGQKLALKRYLQALADGGFRYIIQDTNGLLDLKDPDKTSMDALYKLYEQYGLEVFHGIPENYLRSLLPYLSTAWSYKGSIDIVEFVCTTLSGIKVSSQVDYIDNRTAVFGEAVFGEATFGNVDSFAVPRVTVRLEMDFALSDYFPNSEQFHRILTNFLPFYCDLALVYSYVYSDENALIFREVEIDHIKDTKTESRNVRSVEYERNKMKYTMNDSGSIVSSGSAVFQTGKPFGEALFSFEKPDEVHIHYAVQSDFQRLEQVENEIDHIKDTKEESASALRYGVIQRGNAVFNIASPMGVSVLGNDLFKAPTEYAKDTFRPVYSDTQKLNPMGSAKLGTTVLNNFYLGLVPFEQKVKQTLTDNVGVESEDTCSSVIGTMSMLNATLGHAVLGRPKFNNTSFDYVQVSY